VARTIGKLTALKVDKEKRPGMHADGGGLYLRVTRDGTKNWVFRFMLNGKARWMGLGPVHTVTLADARARATAHRRLRLDGIDPIEHRRAEKQQAKLEASRAVTFKTCADSYIAAHSAGWRSAKHAAQWSATLEAYALPVIGGLSVQTIGTAEIAKVLEPIWTTKTETASRVRGRIEAVLDWAKAHGYRVGENPARWRGHLDILLPARSKVRRVKHHAALHYADIGEFIAQLRKQEGVSARALEFAILTAARTGEVIGATWGELDVKEEIWIIPAERMKANKEHRVPLSPWALKIVQDIRKQLGADPAPSAFIFPGIKTGRPLSNMAFLMLMRRMEREDLTVHGFRSTFRDWTAECTNYPREVAEMALAHAIGDKVEAAYRRGDLFEKRRRLMRDWARYCNTIQPAARSSVADLRVARYGS